MKTQKNTLHINSFDELSVGVDVEQISRFKKYASNIEEAKKLKVFSDNELNYSFSHSHPEESLCVRFCAKEAVYKALSQANLETLPAFSEIEILNKPSGVPYVNFLNKEFKNIQCKLSLSHSRIQPLQVF